MNTTINNGGPAFPVHIAPDDVKDVPESRQPLRGKANPKLHAEILTQGQAWVETSAFGWADAMLKASVTQ
jgi:hypothetical protein